MYIETKDRTPLVSVIMPAYNAELYIREAIESVLSQSVVDLELIVIDDCSSDRTREIIGEYEQSDSRVRVVWNEQNLGVAKTRNRGLDLCKGKYVALLDSDDYWKPLMLEKMVQCAEETGAGIVYCSYEIVDEQGNRQCNDFIVPVMTTFEESTVRSVITCSSVLITAIIAKQNRFPTDIYHEDIALWFQLLKTGVIARGVQDVLAVYRQRGTSRSANKLISAYRRWPIYRKHLGMSVWQSTMTMVRYGYYGLRKYRHI